MESETDDNCYERKDIPVDGFGGDFYHSRDVTTRQLNRHLLTHVGTDLSPAAVGRPISLPAKLPNPDGGACNGSGHDQLDSGANGIDSSTLIRRYAEVTKFKQETTSGSGNSGNRLSKGPESSLALAKKRLSSLHSNVPQNEMETMDDDMMPLLSSNRELSQEELYESHTSLVSSSEGGIMAEGEETSSDESQESNSSANHTAIVMSLLERLLRSHPVWFLPGIQRSGAIHLLQGKEEGTFIVRGSSQSKTMAVSVRLPANAGPYIEHYLIQSNNGQLSLESSRFKFDSIPALIAHYTQCCDELPVQLCLPVALREAKNRQQLSSLALLGQEFWRYPMASSPKPKLTAVLPATTPSATSSHMNTPSEATHSSGIGISVLNHTPIGQATSVAGGTSLGAGGMMNAFGETPTDTFSTLSSFTVSNGQTLLSPESIDSAIMMSPMDPHQNQTGIIGKTSTFKARKQQIVSPTTTQHEVEKQIELFNANILGHGSGGGHSNGEATGGEMTSSTSSSMESRQNDVLSMTGTLERKPRAPRPTPPNTLNIKPIRYGVLRNANCSKMYNILTVCRSPPAPPARRIRLQIAENSSTVEGTTFSLQKDTDFTPTTGFPTKDTAFQRREPATLPTGISHNLGAQVSNTVWYCDSDNVGDAVGKQSMSQSNDHKPEHDHPCFSVPTSTRVSRRNKRKESKHYQESDILESPSVYCRSTLVDKISDYEDIWSQDACKSDRRSLLGQRHGMFGQEDLTLKGLVSPSIESMSYRQGKLTSYRGPAAHGAHTYSVDNLAVGMSGHDSASDRASTPTDRPARPPVALKTFSPIPKEENRFGRSVLTDVVVRQRSCMNISHTTPVGTPVTLEDALSGMGQEQKQNSPFYADPADILSNIIRRSPLNRLASSNSSQRHSEPPKQLFGNDDSLLSAVHPWGNGNGYNVNNNFAASLDELALEKNDSMLSGVRMHALSITGGSSGHGTNDYDSDIRWKTPTASLKTIEPATKSHQKSTDSLMGRPVTIHQIIAKKLPALNLSERLLGGLLANDSSIGTNGESGFGTLGNRGQRKSAYDNVEKQANAYASSAINSAHSDDGTVFSEPWDSSQWDSFLPNEQSSMEAPNMGNNYDHSGSTAKDTRYRKDMHYQLPQSQQKVATILRSRSCRDREILCKRWSHVRYVNRNEATVMNCIFVDGAVSPSSSSGCGYGSRGMANRARSQAGEGWTISLDSDGSSRKASANNVHGPTVQGIVAVASTPLRHEGECRPKAALASAARSDNGATAANAVGKQRHQLENQAGVEWQSHARVARKRPASEDVKCWQASQSLQALSYSTVGSGSGGRFDRLFGGTFGVQDGLPVPECDYPSKRTSIADGKLCSVLLLDGWCRVEYDECDSSSSLSDYTIMIDDCTATPLDPNVPHDADVEQLFGLDEQGNIIINVGHIEEERGRVLLVKKRRYRKIFSRLDQGKEINETTRFDGMWQKLVHKLFTCCEEKLVRGHPRNRSSHNGPGESIATYALYLANKPDSTFSRNISNFIACTKESKAAPHPQVVMRNMRQFMSGMKNYLVKHGEGDFAGEVQKARAQLKPDEFLNLDSILEEVMHKLVILPLREHLYGLFVDYYSQSGDIQLIVEKVRSTAGRGPLAFGIKGNVIPPSPTAMRQIATLFVRLQEAELPLAKLDLLLAAVSTIFEATTCCNGQQLSADDFLPVLVMVVAHCGFIGAEIEAEYMWGLLQPSLLSGEAGYYLTALCSAVHVLKNFSLSEQEGTSTLDWDSSTLPNCSSVLRVIIPDEYNGSIQTRTLPIRPHTTTKEVCRIIAHKARITNAQDYGLFKLIDGEETLLHDTECPQDVRMTAKGKHFMIAYKRIDAKIAWPTVMPNNAASNNNTMTTSTTNNTAYAIANNAIITSPTTTTTTTTTASDNHLKV
uniref:Protein sprint n=1 Tax=Anopheles christyi TaxID=43041 RepID=A0A182K1U2_9DIPT